MIEDIVYTAVVVVTVVALLSVIYKFTPFYKFQPRQAPGFVIFPKYEAAFDAPLEAIQNSLQSLKFKPASDDQLTYRRGKVYGEFSAKFVRLNVEIDPAKNVIRVFVPYMVILFDTGDLWRVTRDILDAAAEYTGR